MRVFLVIGPRRSGKTLLISSVIEEICTREPHYIRLAPHHGSKRAPRRPCRPNVNCGVATATWVDYDPDRIFETLPETLSAVHVRDQAACVVIEADTEPGLRHAYPYDYRVFVRIIFHLGICGGTASPV